MNNMTDEELAESVRNELKSFREYVKQLQDKGYNVYLERKIMNFDFDSIDLKAIVDIIMSKTERIDL